MDRSLRNIPIRLLLDEISVFCLVLGVGWSENAGRYLSLNFLLARHNLALRIAAFPFSLLAHFCHILEVQRLVFLVWLALTERLEIIWTNHLTLSNHFFLFIRLTLTIGRMRVNRILGKLSNNLLIWLFLLKGYLPLGLKLRVSDCEENLVILGAKMTIKSFC